MTAEMANALRDLGDEVGTAQEAIRELYADYGDKASGILAKAFDVTTRTGERWISWAHDWPSQQSDPTRYAKNRPRIGALINLMKNRRAAKRLRQVRKIKVGKVRVINTSPAKGKKRAAGTLDPRPRNIGDRTVTGVLGTAVEAATELVAAGEYDRAAEVIEDGILEAYGVPEGALQIESYQGRLEFEE